MASSAYTRRQHILGSVIALLLIAAAVGAGWLYIDRSKDSPLSEEAIIGASIVNIAASVPGRIISLEVSENQKIEKGALLFSLDPEPFRLAADQARADLKIAEATRDTQMRSIRAEQSNAVIAMQQVERARTNLALAEQTLARLTPLLPKGYVTAQQVDDARTARDDARTSLDQAIKQSEAADSLVGTIDAAEALVEARQAALAIAERGLADTKVYAPHNGRVVGLNISSGEIVAPGQSVFTLVNTDDWFASAFFRETELPSIAVGDCARVYVMADRSRPLEGRVQGIGWGVISESLVNLPRSLPYVPKSLNWVRIAQSFPVRIQLTDPPEDLMRIGASAVAIVNHGKAC